MLKPNTQNVVADSKVRSVQKTIKGSETSDGAGVRLRRYIASPELNMLDPFLLLDVFRSDNPNDYIAGFPPHPHRGFETVTYLLHGNMRHKDSAGHEGVIKSGGVQWMTAGRGIEHSEMPEQEQGLLFGFQLWVNLPATEKMTTPRYQEFEADDIPVEQRHDGTRVKVIAGTTIEGTRGAVTDIAAKPVYMDIHLQQAKVFEEVIAYDHNAFIYVISGEIQINKENLVAETLVTLSQGDRVLVTAAQDSRFLLVAGKPFNEPVARGGPFVMNTDEEIHQAYNDYRSGQFGKIIESNQ